MRELYFRCNGGHYFRAGDACPFDGWTIDGLAEANQLVRDISATTPPTLELLRRRGVAVEVLKRALLIEFGDPLSSFEALVPERYLHRGKELLAHEVGKELV